MSADLMLVNKGKGMYFEGDKSDKCVCIDETSGGDPHTDFGKMVRASAGGWGLKIDDEFIEKVKKWYEVLEHKDYVDIEEITKWLEGNKGEYLDFECW